MVLPQSIEARRYSPLNKPYPTRSLVGWMRLLALTLIGIIVVGLVLSSYSSSQKQLPAMFDFKSPDFKPASLVGYCLVEENQFQADQALGKKVLTASMLPEKRKIVHPGQMTTQEFEADRLFLQVDANNCIVKARWG